MTVLTLMFKTVDSKSTLYWKGYVSDFSNLLQRHEFFNINGLCLTAPMQITVVFCTICEWMAVWMLVAVACWWPFTCLHVDGRLHVRWLHFASSSPFACVFYSGRQSQCQYAFWLQFKGSRGQENFTISMLLPIFESSKSCNNSELLNSASIFRHALERGISPE